MGGGGDVTGPPTCSTCRQPWLLWHGMDEPSGPGRPHPDGECYWCSKIAATANGGLPTAQVRGTVLDQLLASFDAADDRLTARLRGIRYSVSLGGQTLELMA
jgi:hypothetical protein